MSESNKDALEKMGKSFLENYRIPTLPESSNLEPDYKALDEMYKNKKRQDRVNFWVPVIISLIAIAISLFK